MAEIALEVLEAHSDSYMRGEALACLEQCGTKTNVATLHKLLTKPGTAGEFKQALEETLSSLSTR